MKYLDNNTQSIKYTFFPYDNPILDTEEKIKDVLNTFPANSSLQEQKIFNRWVVASGRVFTKLNIVNNLDRFQIREIGIGIDYGSVNPTTFVPIALAFDEVQNKWVLIRLQCYYHDCRVIGDTPTTEYFSKQLRLFIKLLRKEYDGIPITDIVIDSEASHFANRLDVDRIPFINAKKGAGSVDRGVQSMQSLIYKQYLYIYEKPSIKHIYDNLEMELAGKDDSKIEFESYQYDTIKTSTTGQNCYKKELDHCLTEDTIIATPNGNHTIKELIGTEGECFCYDIENKKITISKYGNVKKTQTNIDIYELELENGYKIKGTYDHPVLTTKGYKLLGILIQYDKVLTRQGNIAQPVRVKSVKKIGKADTYNMEVKKYHNFIANGIIVHNSVDGSRYLLQYWQEINKCPII